MAILSYTDDLVRKRWVREGLIQKASESFWSPFTQLNRQGIVYQVNNESAGEGHTVVFDFKGNLSGAPKKGKETATGTGEEKRKFSDKITVDRYRFVVDNGDKFDGVEVGDLSINEHQDSRAMLADLFIRFKDQALFDAAQGFLGQAPSHMISLSTFDYNDLLEVEKIIKTGDGFDVGSKRRPLAPYKLQDGRTIWLFIVDTYGATKLKASSGYQSIVSQADVRGSQNRIINGVIGRIGNFLVVEAQSFFGYSSGTGALNTTEVEIAGLRRINKSSATSVAVSKWEGESGFNSSSNVYSRGLICGAGALMLAFGKMPDYKFQESTDFGINSESLLEVWMNVQKTRLTLEAGSNYKQAKVTDIDWGVVAVDITL